MAGRLASLCGVLLLVVIGWGASPAAATGCPQGLTSVSIVLKWFLQGQFAGPVVAQEMGFYAEQCLSVSIVRARHSPCPLHVSRAVT
jgi:NitT/TauT family transport system substrate-binding protein